MASSIASMRAPALAQGAERPFTARRPRQQHLFRQQQQQQGRTEGGCAAWRGAAGSVRAASGSGFGAASPKAAKKQPKLARYLETPTPGADAADSDGWIVLPEVDATATFVSKPIKAVILASGRAICLYKVNDTIYCSDANSTAYQYPLADASIIQVKGAPAVEVKLDGTVYDLATGKVLSWCPKNTAARKVLGALKDRSDPVDLPMHPVQVRGSAVSIKLSY